MELRQSVERYNLALLATRDGIWEWDLHERRMYFSTRFCEILGFTPAERELERTYQAWANRIHPSHRPDVEQKLQAHLRNGSPFEVEYQHLHRTGEYRWQKAIGQALFDDEGIPFRMAGSIRDITHEKKVEEDIRREKEFSDSIINSLPGVFYLMDESGHLERWNRNLEKVVRRSRSEVAQMPPLELVAPGDRERVLQVFESVMQRGWGNTEVRLLRADGTTSDFYVNGKVIRQDGRPALVGMGIDISERKEAERLLRQSELKYHMLFDFNPVPLFVVRASDFALIDVNMAALKHYRYTREEFLSMRYCELEFGPGAVISDPYRCLAEGVATHRRKDGQRLQVEVSQHRIDYNNEEALLFLCLDVTDKLKNEELLRQSYDEIRELASHLQEVREKERTEIARDIHDELGQALTAIKMNLSSILRKQGEPEANLAKIKESLTLTEQTMT
ncbi:MAG: PAS domain S-box protein, partial [Chitinophagaceae bacterium]